MKSLFAFATAVVLCAAAPAFAADDNGMNPESSQKTNPSVSSKNTNSDGSSTSSGSNGTPTGANGASSGSTGTSSTSSSVPPGKENGVKVK